jgi:GNAT superfamily N-acetyltransferase
MEGAVPDRILAGMAAASRRRAAAVRGGEVLEHDGLVLALSNLADPSLNGVYVERAPSDARAALAWAAAEVGARGHAFGIDRPVGRFPELDEAIGTLGLRRIESRPMMVADPSSLPPAEPPAGISIRPVRTRSDALALARVDAEAWGGEMEHSVRAFADGVLGVDGVGAFVAWDGDVPVGCAVAHRHQGSIGLFGVGVVPDARRRGLGSALTVAAARSTPTDLSWLFPSEMAAAMYRRLGFGELETWEVWVDPGGPDPRPR